MKTVMLSYPLTPEMLSDSQPPQVIAIGQFDGIHLGHVSVISSAIDIAKEKRIPSAVVTFNPHPKDVMGKGNYDGYLTPLQDKQALLEELGIDTLYVAQFNEEFSRVSPQDFFSGVLLPLNIDTVVVGFDFRFGYQGAGDVEMLREMGQGVINVEITPPFLLDGQKVSSSIIRKALQIGDLALANKSFGHPYQLKGIVVDGEKRGRTIGFPTANLKLDDRYVVPAKGVYAIRTFYDGKWIPGVMNIGVKPTFQDGIVAPSYEAHLFHFNQNIYGEHLTIELVHFLREERRFASIEQLIAQIGTDAQLAEELLKS
ncbi:riboflavin biosynthesis protein RibF [Paenibacillus sp. CMAA1364]